MSLLVGALDAARGLVPTLPDPSSLLSSFASAFDPQTRLLKLSVASSAGIPAGTLLPHRLSGHEAINQGFRFELEGLSNNAHLELKTLLGVGIQVSLLTDAGEERNICGLVTEVHQEGGDGGFAAYRLVIEDGLSVLRLRKTSRVFMDASVLDVTQTILDGHLENNPALAGAFSLDNRCQKKYSQRPFWMQYGESDLAYLRRIWAREGISYVIKPSEGGSDGQPQHTLVLFDDVMDLDENAVGTVRFHRADGVEAKDAITQWHGRRVLQSGAVARSAWNHGTSSVSMASEESQADQGDGGASLSSSLEDYQHEASLEGDDAEAFAARTKLQMQAREGWAKCFEGSGTVRSLAAGTWFTLQEHPIHDNDAAQDREFILTGVDVEAVNNLPKDLTAGLSALLGQCKASKSETFRSSFTCVRRGIPILAAELPAPRPGLLSAHVVGPAGEEVHVDAFGRIRVRFQFVRADEHAGAGASGTDADSAWVRVSSMWSSQGYGSSFHPRVGDEVLIQFLGHDPDRPLVAGSLSNGVKHPAAFSGVAMLPATKALSGFRSQMHKGTGSNELVFDDSPKELRLRLACDHAASQLNLGYLVQPRAGGPSSPLGEGFELRTCAWGALRAAKGLLLSTDGGSGDHIDAAPLVSQLESGLDLAKGLSEASENHKADLLGTNDTVKGLKEGLAGARKTAGKDVAAFEDPILALSSPAGILSATPASQVLSAGEAICVTSGQDTNLAVGGSLVMAVKEAWSVFVAKSGIKLFAGKGDVDIQAHDGSLSLTADHDVKVYAINGDLSLLAKNGLTLATSGAKVELKGGTLTITAAKCNVKTGGVEVKAGGKVDVELPKLPKGGEIKVIDPVKKRLGPYSN